MKTRPKSELAKPRLARGGGPLPTHVSYIFHDSDGGYRLQIHQHGKLSSRLGFHRELVCADSYEFDAQMDFLIGKRVPFMVGHMIPGPSDDAWFWLKAKGRHIDYLEISYGGRTAWQVREIFEDAKEWRGVKLAELLPPEIDLFAPENRPPVVRPAPPAEAAAEPEPPPAAAEPTPEPPPTAPPPSPPPPPPDEPAPATPTPAAAAREAPPELPATPPPEPEPASVQTKESPLPGRRRVEYGSALILVLVLGGSFWRATNYFGHIVPFDPAPFLWAVFQAALAGGTAYAALWFTLFPRHFPRWTQRLELLALSILACALIAFCELMIANIRLDDAPRITVPTEVRAKAIFKGKNGRYPPEYWEYQLHVVSWTDPEDEQYLRVSRQDWERLEAGDRIVFRPHPGRLGWVWYTRDELEAADFLTLLRP